MIHQYKLNGYNIVLDVFSGAVHLVDDVSYDVIEMLETVDTDLCEIITVFVGKSVNAEQRVELTESLKVAYDECEIVVYEGGQDVYDYLIAVE